MTYYNTYLCNYTNTITILTLLPQRNMKNKILEDNNDNGEHSELVTTENSFVQGNEASERHSLN